MAPTEAALLIDVGASLTKINIVSANATLFTRDVAVGGMKDDIRIGIVVGATDACPCGCDGISISGNKDFLAVPATASRDDRIRIGGTHRAGIS